MKRVDILLIILIVLAIIFSGCDSGGSGGSSARCYTLASDMTFVASPDLYHPVAINIYNDELFVEVHTAGVDVFGITPTGLEYRRTLDIMPSRWQFANGVMYLKWGNRLAIYDIHTGEQLSLTTIPGVYLLVDGDDGYLYSASPGLTVINVADPTAPVIEKTYDIGQAVDAPALANGTFVYSDLAETRIYQLSLGELTQQSTISESLKTLALSQDGHLVAVGTRPWRRVVYDLADLTDPVFVTTLPDRQSQAMQFDCQYFFIYNLEHSQFQVYDTSTWELLRNFALPRVVNFQLADGLLVPFTGGGIDVSQYKISLYNVAEAAQE